MPLMPILQENHLHKSLILKDLGANLGIARF